MPGAPIPKFADSVVMKENVRLSNGKAEFYEPTFEGQNIRYRGEDVEKNSVVAKKGQKISSAMIGLFCGLGLKTLEVFKQPSVAIICTGDELVNPPEPLLLGQVYYLVGAMLKNQCRAMGIKNISCERTGDNEAQIKAAIEKNLHCDLILITGGMSMGDYDFVPRVLNSMNAEIIFHKGKWRPGKPLLLAQKNKCTIFGLPGNPVACFVGCQIFVRNWLFARNERNFLSHWLKIKIANNFQKKSGFSLFARAKINEEGQAQIFLGQGSHQLLPLAKANCLLWLPELWSVAKSGETVNYLPL
jgi:molybdopterin molybdotransferase